MRGGRIRELEEELRVVKADLQQEKEEKVDLVTEKVWIKSKMVKQSHFMHFLYN